MKKFFFYYRSYYNASKNLSEDKYVKFHTKLYKCHLGKEDTIELVNKVDFKDSELNKAWETVKEQVKKHDRGSKNYRLWKKSVFTRDNYTCRKCNSKERIEAHHIIRWVDNIDLRYELDNGLTLCYKCHKLEHKGNK